MTIKQVEKCPYCKGHHTMVIGEYAKSGYCTKTEKRIIMVIDRDAEREAKRKVRAEQ